MKMVSTQLIICVLGGFVHFATACTKNSDCPWFQFCTDGNVCVDPACFAQDSSVNVLSQGPTPMKDLRVGDKIFTGEKTGYETVYAFAHWDPSAKADFLEITVAHHTRMQDQTDSVLKVTSDHLVHLEKDRYVAAAHLQVGDVLVDDDKSTKVIQKIQTTKDNGLYTPLTPSGTLMVDNVKASCYVSMQEGSPEYVKVAGYSSFLSHHTLLHIGAAPIRMFCMGIAPQFCSNDVAIDPETGLIRVAAVGFALVEFMEHPTWTMLLPMVLLFALLAPLYLLESILAGPAIAPTVLVLLFVAFQFVSVRKVPRGWKKNKKVE